MSAESNVSLFFIIIGTLILLWGLKKRSSLAFLGFIFYILTFYTYNSYRVFTPLFALTLLLLYRKNVLFFAKNKKAMSIVLGLGLVLFMLPFTFFATSTEGLIRARSEFFMRDVKLTVSTPTEKVYKIVNRFTENYFSYFSLEFLFFHGDYNGRHSVREIGELYIWQMPFLIYGLYKGIKEKKESDNLFIAWLFAAPIAGALATPNPHALRTLIMVIPLIYFISRGLINFFRKYQSSFLSLLLSFIFVYFLYQYLHIYYIHYPKITGPDWSDGYRETAKSILQNEKNYPYVVINSNFSKGYMYLFFYGDFDPNVVQTYTDPNKSFDKYLFVDSYKNTTGKKILYVARDIEEPDGRLLHTIRNSGNDIVFELWEI